MSRKPSEYKQDLEKEINTKLKEFVENTGLSVSYVDFTRDKQTGFVDNKESYNTKIILKNE
jgi:hypothetical protein